MGRDVIGMVLTVALSLLVSFDAGSEAVALTPEFFDRNLRQEVKYDLLGTFDGFEGGASTVAESSRT